MKVAATARMVKLGAPIEDITAPAALSGLLRASAGHVSWLAEEVAALDSLASHEAEVLVRLYTEERNMLARVSEACIRAGVAEAEVRLMESQAAATLRVIRDAAREIGLSDRQLQALGVAMRKQIAASSPDPEQAAREVAQADARLAELREQQQREDARRIAREAKHEAERLSGLTFPPSEWVPEDPAA